MSYILEALKKAQAERQLGNAPTLHAAQPVVPALPASAASRKPLLVGLGAGALVVVAGAVLLWRSAPGPGPATQVAAVASAPAAAGSPAAGSPAAGSPAAGSPVVANSLEVSAPPAPPQEVRAPQPRVMQPAPAPVALRAVPQAVPPAPPAPVVTAVRTPTAVPTPAPVAATAPARTQAPAAAPDDSLPYLQQLPESVQREVPRVAFGGYMYSANPADRLLLVDKALRHEGEEVAPGLILEKLLPRAAVMNYRGVRYRVSY
jgi:general secretion pathway protein B